MNPRLPLGHDGIPSPELFVEVHEPVEASLKHGELGVQVGLPITTTRARDGKVS